MKNFLPQKDVEIEYGKPGAEGNAAGKIVRRTDGTGTVEYEYGLLGEMTVEGRTIRHGLYESTALTLYQSDYLGRMEYIVYPDGETVSYGYDDGGNVCSVTGTKDGYADVEYVRDIGYDEYGQRVYIAYGNGVTTNYTYDERRRWLKNLVTESESDGQVQNIAYSFDRVGNVLGYSNSGNKEYETVQSYKYDSLYQLVEAEGTSSHIKSTADRPAFTATYRQIFSFSTDGLCNMTAKSSSQNETYEDDLNYSLDYEYEAGFVHRLARAGDRYYKYDASGNLVREQERSFDETEGSEDVTYRKVSTEDGGRNVSSVDYAWAASNDTKNASVKDMYYWREFTWNEDNMLIQTRDNDYITTYLYGQDNQRAVKSSAQSETFYFNKFFTHRFDDSDNWAAGRMSKHIYLGSDRIVTKVSMLTRLDYEADDTEAEASHTYYYHSDHLGSAQTITNCDGDLYERLEYTPYGEVWLDEGGDYVRTEDTFSTPYRFTGKERDEETGLYYYGARYLDSKYSRWISTDPALAEYIPLAPVSDEARKYNQNLPGMGGVFNTINCCLYHYAGNNPVKYTDPDGRFAIAVPLIPILFEVAKDGLIISGAVLGGLLLGKGLSSLSDTLAKSSNEEQPANQVKNDLQGNAQAAAPSPIPPDNDDDYYKSNPKHNPNAKGNASVEPKNASEMFDKSVKDSNGTRWYKDKNGTLHRFQGSNHEYHWNGSFDKGKYPGYITKDPMLRNLPKGDI